MAMVMERRLLTVKEVAGFLGLKPKTVYQRWPEWTSRYQLHPVRVAGRMSLRFWSNEIEQMASSWEVVTS